MSHERIYDEDLDPTLSPGFYEQSSVMSGGFARDMADYHDSLETERNKKETSSLNLTESFVFQKEQEIFGWPLIVSRGRVHNFLKVAPGTLVRRLSDELHPFQVRIDGKDYGFSLSDKPEISLKPISKAKAVGLLAAQLLRDGR